MTCRIILLALFIRVLIALATRTFFQPDEYFQSLEVAHHLAFGYGRLTWEWLAQDPIRSIFYPALNAPVYFALKQLKLDNTRWLIWGPKILHGVLASGTDIALARLTRRVLGEKYVTTAIFLSLTSVFHGLALSRSLSNSLETTFTTIALSFLPWDFTLPGWRNELQISLQFAAFACAVRPTSAVIWIYIFPLMLWQQRRNIEVITVTFTKGIFMGVLWCWFMFILDSNYFGKPTFTALNFLRANLSSISLFYGANSWHYYFTQAIPILCTTTLPFVLHGAWLASRPDGTRPAKVLLGLTAWTVLIYSLAGHKEWRFIHPLLPIMHIFAAKSLVDSFTAS
ncbi:Mannosyltransferase, partial [Abortiporus biennis]